MAQPPVIEIGPDGKIVRDRSPLRGSRLVIAAAIAAVELVAVLLWSPNMLLLLLGVTIAMVVAGWAALRIARPGAVRDLLWIVALSQAIVIATPAVIAISALAAVIVGVLVLLGAVALLLRRRSSGKALQR